MDDLLMSAPEARVEKLKKKKAKKKAAAAPGKHHGINVHVNVVNTAGDGHKKPSNEADNALRNLRGY